MDTQPLKYSEELDQIILKAIENDLDLKVISAEKITGGEFNYSYKITTEKGLLIARVFRERNSPQDGKLEWIEEQLSQNNIPHAKMIFYTLDNTYFPHGYMVSEFLEGKDGFKAIMEKDVSFEEFFNKLVVLLHQVHNIPTQGFGEIINGKGEYETYYDYKLSVYKNIYEKLKSLNDIDKSVHEKVLKEIEKLRHYEGVFKSVLLHGDPPPGNSIYTSKGEVILIDWDNAKSSSWIDEYVGLATRGAFMWQHELSEEERNEIIKKSFRNFYQGVNFDDGTLLVVTEILKILNAYGGLATHYFQHEDKQLYEVAKRRLHELLGFNSPVGGIKK